MRSRGHPSVDVQVDTLLEQDDRCLYCGLKFGDLVIRKGNDWVWLGVTWDHFVPFAYSNRNPDDNWVAACQLCNGYKGSQMFDDLPAVRAYIEERARVRRHDPMPLWHVPDEVPDEVARGRWADYQRRRHQVEPQWLGYDD